MPQHMLPCDLGAGTRGASYLAHADGRYYELMRKNAVVLVRWGKAGHFGQASEHRCLSEDDATRYVDARIRERNGEGYVDATCPDTAPSQRGGCLMDVSNATMHRTFHNDNDQWYEVVQNGRVVRTMWGTISSGNEFGTIRCWLFPTTEAAAKKATEWCKKRVNPTYYKGYVEVAAGLRDDF